MNLDRMELAALAHRRYPDMELPLAVMCFESDRRRAGLGALDERKRGFGKSVSNYKRDVMERGGVTYHLRRYTPARREYAPTAWDDIDWSADAATATVQTVEVKALEAHLCVDATYRDLSTQSGRKWVSVLLRRARRQLTRSTD